MAKNLVSAQFSENLRYLMWQARVPRSRWIQRAADWLGVNEDRAEAVLLGAAEKPMEVASLSVKVDVDEEALTQSRLAAAVRPSLLQQNIIHLASMLKHGDKGALAHALGVHPTTLSRWLAGSHKPEQKSLSGMAGFFGVTLASLLSDALFLSLEPVGDRDRREWLHAHVDKLDAAWLQKLFPALERLMGET